jgi:hypothetical protein
MTRPNFPVLRPIQPQPTPETPLPKLGFVAGPGPIGWEHVARYIINPAAVDTTQFGDIPMPTQYNHAMFVWRAFDTSAATSASFFNMQIGVAGGATDTGATAYNWVDFATINNNGALSNASGGAPAGGDSRWAAGVTSGGATGAGFWSKGHILLPFYSATDLHATAEWETGQINAATAIRRMGFGYYSGPVGPVTKVRFSSTNLNFAALTTFDLFVSK